MSPFWASFSLVFVAAIWGIGFPVTKAALEVVGPATLLAGRFLMAALVSFVLVQKKPLRSSIHFPGLFIGATFGVGYLFQTKGLETTTSSNCAFITGLNIAIVPFIAFFLLKQSISKGVLSSLLLSVGGLYFLSVTQSFEMSGGDFWVLACAFFFALHIVLISYFLRTRSSSSIVFSQIIGVTSLTVVASLIFEPGQWTRLIEIFWHLAFLGVLGSGIALLLMTQAQKTLSATQTGLILIMEPVFGALFGHVLEGDQLTERQLVGCFLIVLGMVGAVFSQASLTFRRRS